MVLLYLPKAEQAMRLVMQDGGQGFNLEEAYSRKGTARGLGLGSMRERTELSGGPFRSSRARGQER